jgi:erythromycin esterase
MTSSNLCIVIRGGVGEHSRCNIANAGRDATVMDTHTEWIKEHAQRIASLDPEAPRADLQPLRDAAAGADVVGLGQSTHGAHEQFALKQRMVQLLVGELGFRSLALEEDWTKGIEIDRYVVSGEGDIRAIVADAGIPWRSEEMVATIEWLRRFNETHHTDPVRFIGVDIVAIRALAYEAIAEYVRLQAPDRAEELKGHYDAIYPRGPVFQHIQWYRGVDDKQPLVAHAHQVHALLEDLPETDGHALALQHARAIAGFYEYHAQNSVALRDRRMAESIVWWQEHTGHKLVYWAANVHTANAPQLTISYPPFSPATHASAGSLLRQKYGAKYLSVGFVFGHGSVNAGFAPPAAHEVPAPPADFVEAGFTNGDSAMNEFIVDLRRRIADGDSWLTRAAKTRVIGPAYDRNHDAAYSMTGGSLAEWFDLLVYQRKVSPTHLLPQQPMGRR